MPKRGPDPSLITSFYIKERYSCAQIAKQLGCSKTSVITALKRRGLLRKRKGAQTNPQNYLNSSPPYGYRALEGKLSPNPSELQVCRLIVDWVDRRGLNYLQTAQCLAEKGYKTRKGK